MQAIKKAISVLVLFSVSAGAFAAPTADQIVTQSRQSALFIDRFSTTELESKRLQRIRLADGINLELGRYVELTRLDRDPSLRPLFRPAIQRRFLVGAPRYDETATELEDRVVIDRVLHVSIKRGTCSRNRLPQSLAGLCLKRIPGPIPKDMYADLARIREKLRQAPSDREVKQGVTAAGALRMTDNALLELLMNSGERTIRRTSVLPKLAFKNKPRVELMNFDRPMDRVDAIEPAGALSVDPEAARQLAQRLQLKTKTKPVPAEKAGRLGKRYFLAGKTIGREIGDTYEYTFSKESWCCDRYFVRLSYSARAGFGLRMPFSVEARYRSAVRRLQSADDGQSDSGGPVPHRIVNLVVAPASLEEAWRRVGLPAQQYFEGREFVLELGGSCDFHASIPGPDITGPDCPRVEKSASKEFVPVIGSGRRQIANAWLLDHNTTGLGIDAYFGSAGIDLGVSADMTGGRIGLGISPASESEIHNLADSPRKRLTRTEEVHRVWFRGGGNAGTHFTVGPVRNGRQYGFVLQQPRYRFDLELRPEIRGVMDLDLGVYEYNHVVGPFALDVLTFTKEFDFGTHENTRGAYEYALQSQDSSSIRRLE